MTEPMLKAFMYGFGAGFSAPFIAYWLGRAVGFTFGLIKKF